MSDNENKKKEGGNVIDSIRNILVNEKSSKVYFFIWWIVFNFDIFLIIFKLEAFKELQKISKEINPYFYSKNIFCYLDNDMFSVIMLYLSFFIVYRTFLKKRNKTKNNTDPASEKNQELINEKYDILFSLLVALLFVVSFSLCCIIFKIETPFTVSLINFSLFKLLLPLLGATFTTLFIHPIFDRLNQSFSSEYNDLLEEKKKLENELKENKNEVKRIKEENINEVKRIKEENTNEVKRMKEKIEQLKKEPSLYNFLIKSWDYIVKKSKTNGDFIEAKKIYKEMIEKYSNDNSAERNFVKSYIILSLMHDCNKISLMHDYNNEDGISILSKRFDALTTEFGELKEYYCRFNNFFNTFFDDEVPSSIDRIMFPLVVLSILQCKDDCKDKDDDFKYNIFYLDKKIIYDNNYKGTSWNINLYLNIHNKALEIFNASVEFLSGNKTKIDLEIKNNDTDLLSYPKFKKLTIKKLETMRYQEIETQQETKPN